MKNKKALGLHWLILILAFIISLGIVMFSNIIGSEKVPKVGEFSVGISKIMEKNSITPEIIGRIIEKINEVSVDDLKEIEGLISDPQRFDSYCEEPYKGDISRRMFRIEYSRGSVWVHCLANEPNLKSDFKVIFGKNYGAFRPPLLKENDVRYYIPSFQKKDDGTYFDIIKRRTSNRLTVPITIGTRGNEKEIGDFYIDPSFKFPVLDSSSVAYDFYVEPGTARERCTFSAGCTTTQEVIDKNTYITNYEKRKVKCDDYPECDEVIDKSGKNYHCVSFRTNGLCVSSEKLCRGECTPYCSSGRYTEDSDSNTNCRPPDCSDYDQCGAVEGTLDSCYCPDNEKTCTGRCLPYCSNPPEDKTEDGRSNTNCKENPCNSYAPCDITSACACSSGNACSGACIPYCSSDDASKTVDADGNTNCRSDYCSSNIYVPGTCESTLACYCPMSYFECDGTCELCDYGGWVDAGGGCGEGSCSDTQILQQKVLTNGCPTKTRCEDRESLCKPYCSNPPEGEIDDGADDTKCLVGNCADDYANCITTDSCVCASGNACSGACTAA